MGVNWNEPIEAVHEDGRVSPAQYLCSASGDTRQVKVERYGEEWGNGVLFSAKKNRSYTNALANGYVGHGWTIRNVQAAAAKPAISDELVERMVAHFRGVVKKYEHVAADAGNMNDDLKEARAIVADLPKPVDPDLEAARNLVGGMIDGGTKSLDGDATRSGARDKTFQMQVALAAIKRGRALAGQQS